MASPDSLQEPEVIPGVSSAYKHGWKTLWPSFGMLFLAGLIYLLIVGIFTYIDFSITYGLPENTQLMLSFTLSVLSFFLFTPFYYGLSYCFLKAARDRKVEVKNLFAAFNNYWSTLASYLLTGIIIGAGLLLLIVPGIIFACKLAFVPYLVVDRKMGPINAISESWSMTRGHAGKVFLIGLLAIPIMIAGFICLIIGFFITGMWVYTAFAALYYAVSQQRAFGRAGIEAPYKI